MAGGCSGTARCQECLPNMLRQPTAAHRLLPPRSYLPRTGSGGGGSVALPATSSHRSHQMCRYLQSAGPTQPHWYTAGIGLHGRGRWSTRRNCAAVPCIVHTAKVTIAGCLEMYWLRTQRPAAYKACLWQHMASSRAVRPPPGISKTCGSQACR